MKIEAKVLKAALSGVTSVIERRNTIPILSNVLLVASTKGLTLTGTDLDLWVERQVTGDGKAAFRTTVEAHTLAAIVNKLPAADVVDLKPGDGKLAVTCGRSRFTLPTLPAEDFPVIATMEGATCFDLPAAMLAEALATVDFAMSSEETRYYLNGIYWHVVTDPPELRLVATDGHRLARILLDRPAGAEALIGPILPRKAVAVLAKLIGGSEDAVEIMMSATKARFRVGDDVVTTKLIDGSFPDYTRVIPQANDKLLRFDPRALEAVIGRVTAVSTDKTRAVKLSLSKDKAVLSVSSPDSGSASEEMEVDYAAAPVDVGFNARYLLDVLSRVGGEVAEAHLADKEAPVLVRESDKAAAAFVVMPMRV